MKSKIRTIHEEIQEGDENKTIGVLYNYVIGSDAYETLFYVYRDKTLIFFTTVTELVEYSLYGNNKTTKRAYLKEDEFDVFYDKTIDGLFSEHLVWGT